MRQVLRAAVFSLLVFVVLPAFAADEKKPDADKKDVDKKDDKKDDKKPEMVAAGTVTGKIITVDETKRSLKVKVEWQELEINQGELQGLNNDLVQLQQTAAQTGGNVQQQQQRIQKINQLQNSIANHKAKLYKPKNMSKDVDINSTEDVKVRAANPPAKFDDKGNPVKYTEKELKELKGEDKKTPGYPAEFGDLRSNQIVQIALVKKKGTPMLPKPNPADKGGKDVDKPTVNVNDLLSEYAPQANLILIIAEQKNP